MIVDGCGLLMIVVGFFLCFPFFFFLFCFAGSGDAGVKYEQKCRKMGLMDVDVDDGDLP